MPEISGIHSVGAAEPASLESLRVPLVRRIFSASLLSAVLAAGGESSAQDFILPPLPDLPPPPALPDYPAVGGRKPTLVPYMVKEPLQGVRLTSGRDVTGTIGLLTSQQVCVHTPDGGIQSFSISETLIVVGGACERSPLPLRMFLNGGGYISADAIELTRDKGEISIGGNLSAALARKNIRAILFNNDKSCDGEWDRLIQRPQEVRDLLVLKKGEGRLDFLKGVVSSITADSVSFHFDGQDLNIPRAKLFGVILPAESAEHPTRATVHLQSPGHRLECTECVLRDGKFEAVTVCGERIVVPAENYSIDFRPGKTRALQELPSRVLRWNPLANNAVDGGADALLDSEQKPVTYTVSRRDGLAHNNAQFNGELSCEFLLRRQFTEARAIIEYGEFAPGALKIFGDGNPLFELKREEGGALKPRSAELNISLKDIQKLEIFVEPGCQVQLSNLYFVIAR